MRRLRLATGVSTMTQLQLQKYAGKVATCKSQLPNCAVGMILVRPKRGLL